MAKLFDSISVVDRDPISALPLRGRAYWVVRFLFCLYCSQSAILVLFEHCKRTLGVSKNFSSQLAVSRCHVGRRCPKITYLDLLAHVHQVAAALKLAKIGPTVQSAHWHRRLETGALDILMC